MSTIDKNSLVQRLLAYVQIDSETGFEADMSARLVQDFKDMGCEVYTDSVKEATKSTGNNVYAILKGDESLEPLLFCSHMDTVVPGKGIKPKVCDDGYIRSDGTTILGGDDKAGICAIMEAMIAAKSGTHRTVQAIITVREESGMFGAKNLDYSKVIAKNGIILDSSGGPNAIITGAPGQNKITAKIKGRTAHAGIEPESGISAIQVAANAVANMQLLRIDEETTCNIGTFAANGPTNIVAENCEIVMEVRSRNTQKLQNHTKHLVDCISDACQKFGASFEHEVLTSYLGYFYEDSHPLVQRVMSAAKSINLLPVTKMSGGGSDANVFNQNGITALNMGVGMEKVHTKNEQLCIDDMVNASRVCLALMRP